jgi:transcriptional regulator with XRE-family HTH domain
MALGEFLRTRRSRVRPDDVGLPGGHRRRVPGLRREEVALLAGISAEYYLRLEQGRDRHPSDQVVAALARALRLAPDESAYLSALARPAPAPISPGLVSDSIRSLIDGWPETAALVQGPGGVTLAANRLAVDLSPHFAEGGNPLRAVFLEPSMRAFYRDWEATTEKAVAFLRSVADPSFEPLISSLDRESPRFRELWARQDVERRTSGLTLVRHPVAGDLDLLYEKLIVPPDLLLITYQGFRL